MSFVFSFTASNVMANSFKWPWDKPGNSARPGYDGGGIASDGSLRGDGSERSPYLIYSEADLVKIGSGEYSTGANYQLQNNVSLRRNWAPIPTFSGIFDGSGFTISNVRVSSNKSNDYVGLFYSSTGTIMALGVEASSVSANASNSSAGAIAGYNSGTITNCYSVGKVSSQGYAAGGLVGANVGVIRNCYSQADVNGGGGAFAGGIAGTVSERGSISTCYSAGRVRGGSGTGGIVGYAYGGRVQDCYYDSNRVGKVSNNEGAGLTSSEMRSERSFRGFDFRRAWTMGKNYPDLRVFS
jgi:hypothetical protein